MTIFRTVWKAAAVLPIAAAANLAAASELAMVSGSQITIRATDHPAAVAEVVFYNRSTNGQRDQLTEHAVSLGDVALPFTFEWGSGGGRWSGADTLHFHSPDYCVVAVLETYDPETPDNVVTVPENETRRALVYDRACFVGM